MTASQVDRISVVPASAMRLRSLDGLRGLAAAVVVLGHTRLVLLQNHPNAVFGLPVISQGMQLLGILGAHAVWLFFILSGLVLSRMLIGSGNFDYGNYVLGRVARLYIPVWAAVAFTLLTMLMVSRGASGLGSWVEAHPADIAPSAVVSDLTLMSGTSGNLSPLWSLQWEVLFSLLLIFYTTLLRRIPPMVGIIVAIVLSAEGQRIGHPVLMYMPMFAIGTLLAFAWERIEELRDRLLLLTGRTLRIAGLVLALVLVVAIEELPRILKHWALDPGALGMISTVGSLLALTAVIVLVAMAKPLRRLFETRLFQWLGVISFSLYLVHEPVLLAFVYLFDASPAALVAGLVLSFAVADVFYRAIEKPSHKFSRKFKRATVRQEVVAEAP